MQKGYVLFNELAGDARGQLQKEVLDPHLKMPLEFVSVKDIDDYGSFMKGLESEDVVVLVGGDGTLNRFANSIYGMDIQNEILYYPNGTGNDFARDLNYEKGCAPFPVRTYLKNLPQVEVKDKTYRFINGVGFGLDGYCCEEGDRLKAIPGKKVNYTAIAIKGLLFAFKPVNATVVVDGEEYSFRKVWIAPTMKGRFYGGGIMPTPNQERGKADGSVSMMLFHGSGKLRTLMIFPAIFKGEHLKYTKNILILSGRDIQVTFDRPCPLQVDGETIVDVTSYHVIAGKQ